jgi:hypothetical protein
MLLNLLNRIKIYIYGKFVRVLRNSDSRILGSVLWRVSFWLEKLFQTQYLPYSLRKLISLAQPSDPLKNKAAPTIDVVIPCHKKDFDNLPLVIEGLRKNVKNPIGKLVLITPDFLANELQSMFPECEVESDESVLGAELMHLIANLVPNERNGWISQQVIKFRKALFTNEVATLIVDADTILLKPRTWLTSDGIQALCIAYEYHIPYKNQQRRFLGGENHLLSFVTHYQLMKRDNVREIMGESGERLLDWIVSSDFSELSPASEFDTYGEWLVLNKPFQISFSKWNNIPAILNPEKISYFEVSQKYCQYHSISNHSWLVTESNT